MTGRRTLHTLANAKLVRRRRFFGGCRIGIYHLPSGVVNFVVVLFDGGDIIDAFEMLSRRECSLRVKTKRSHGRIVRFVEIPIVEGDDTFDESLRSSLRVADEWATRMRWRLLDLWEDMTKRSTPVRRK